MKKLPSVEPILGEPGRFWVTSQTDPHARHVVDVSEGKYGACSCTYYQAEVVPRLREGKPWKPWIAGKERTECAHLCAVRLMLEGDEIEF